LGIGTAINVVGGGIGALLGAKLPETMRRTAVQDIAIVTVLLGASNFLECNKLVSGSSPLFGS
jgi:uncharacterized membrane protein YqgA involved in biofilm formation